MSVSSPAEHELQVIEDEHERTGRLPYSGSLPPFKNRESIKKGIESDLGLGSCQRRAKTVVNAHAEGNMVAQVAIQSELVGIRKLLRVAVGCAEEDRNHFTFRDLDS